MRLNRGKQTRARPTKSAASPRRLATGAVTAEGSYRARKPSRGRSIRSSTIRTAEPLFGAIVRPAEEAVMSRFAPLLALSVSLACAACSGSKTSSVAGGSAKLQVDATTYELHDVVMSIETGESPWFRIDGEPVAHPKEDCVPGLGGGMGLYGELPSAVKRPADLVGERLRVEFSGDGDDANFCFVGMGGLAGAEDAWVTITSVTDGRVAFSMSGSFKVYDERGEGPIKNATANGTAVLRQET